LPTQLPTTLCLPFSETRALAIPDWLDGHLPNLSEHVIVIDDSEFICSAAVKPNHNLKLLLREYWEIRLFNGDCVLPCKVFTYKNGIMVDKKHFVARHHDKRTDNIWKIALPVWTKLAAQGSHLHYVSRTIGIPGLDVRKA